MCVVYNSFMVIHVLIHVGTRNADSSRPNLFLPLPINGHQMANKRILPYRESVRLYDRDYSRGINVVTICTKNREGK